MKKVYLLASALITLSLNAQEFAAVSNNSAVHIVNNKAVLFSQPVTTTDGIVADVLANGNFVACADDFTLAENSTITKISVTGFQNQGDLETAVSTGIMMYIYNDAAGVPNGNPSNAAVVPVAKIDIPSSSAAYSLVKSDTNYIYSVNIPLALGSALTLNKNTKYWVVFAAKTNLTAYTGTTRFNWFAGTVAGSNAKLIDPSNAFGAGATNWTDLSALTATPALNGLAFSIEGETNLATGEVYNSNKVSVSPNPTSDYLTIGGKVQSVEIADASGRKVSAKVINNVVDVKNLAKGVYVIKFVTERGTQTEKFIKK